MTARVVALGDVMVDIVATATAPLARGSDAAATVRSHGGGSAANLAAWLAAVGRPALLVARVGADDAGRAQVAELTAHGVDVRAAFDPERPTGACVVIVEPDGERTFLPDRGANAALSADDLPADAFRAGDTLSVSGYALLAGGPGAAAARAAMRRAHDTGMAVVVDPASSAPLRAVGPAAFLALVVGAALLLPNAEEALALTGEAEPERAARVLAARTGAEVVVTCGAGGAWWSDGARAVHAAGKRVRGDSTGAGDAFAAGWLHARLAGAEVEEALRAANALGARAAARPGARPPGPASVAWRDSLPAMRPFLHVARTEDWAAARRCGEYAVPAGPDAFTHCCYPEQLAGVLARFYSGVPRAELVLLEVAPDGLPVAVEGASDGAGDFPHVYGSIPVAAVTATREVP